MERCGTKDAEDDDPTPAIKTRLEFREKDEERRFILEEKHPGFRKSGIGNRESGIANQKLTE